MRNLAKKERLLESVKGLHKDTLDVLQMDVTSLQSILEAKERVVEKRMDILGKNITRSVTPELWLAGLLRNNQALAARQCATPVWV